MEVSRHFPVGVVASVFLLIFGASLARAQSETEFIAAFAGEWRVYDPGFGADGGQCSLLLKKDKVDAAYTLDKANCGGDLAQSMRWGIADSQLALFDADGKILARMGGNQRRMTGTTTGGKPVVFDRYGVKGPAQDLHAAAKAGGCIYVGFTKQCAAEADLAPPTVAPSGETKVKVIVNLNVRTEARDDAAAVGVVPEGSCVAVDNCLTAVDGVWCQAQFEEKHAWLRKLALRKNKWAIVTFVNKCD
jgi:hypothetical protein